MPLRSVKMKRFILGFHRRVWCPKWTPLSRSWRMVTTAMARPFAAAVLRDSVPRDGRGTTRFFVTHRVVRTPGAHGRMAPDTGPGPRRTTPGRAGSSERAMSAGLSHDAPTAVIMLPDRPDSGHARRRGIGPEPL